jgi:hypothetical protein
MPDSPSRKSVAGYVVAHPNGQIEFRCFSRSYAQCRSGFVSLRAAIGQARTWQQWERDGFCIVPADIRVEMPTRPPA